MNTQHAIDNLRTAKSILLVDWPSAAVPITLLEAGFTVFGYSPGGYSQAALIMGGEKNEEQLVFNQLDGRPPQVDIVNIYRPEHEHPHIIEQHVIPLKAKTIWMHPPVTSAWAKAYAEQHALNFIEGTDIAEVAKQL